mgnify:CR=1 FL=1
MTVPLVRRWLPHEKKHKEEATRSWWIDPGTREEFAAAADREQSRILRSKASTLALGSTIIVGWNASGRKP